MKKNKRKLLTIILGIVMLFQVPVYGKELDKDTKFTIKVAYTNDIHARVDEYAKGNVIGFSKFKTIKDDFQKDADVALTLDGGDLFHGQTIATLVKGESIAKIINACGYDAMTAGNHDWNYGKDRLKELVGISNIKMLTGNVLDSNNNKFFTQEFYTKSSTKDGQTLKVGVFGVIDPKIYHSTAPVNVEGLTFTDMTQYSKQAVASLKEDGCDVVIALTHAFEPEELAKKIDGVDLWLAGHEHTYINSKVTTPNGNTTYIYENVNYLENIGLIQINCKKDNSSNSVSTIVTTNQITYEDSLKYEGDSNISNLISTIKSEQKTKLDEVVGVSPKDLDGDYEKEDYEKLRTGSTKLGKAVASSYLLETGADIAFENAGGIRASIKAGDVTYGDIINVSPYGNYVVTKQLTGKEILNIMEKSIDIGLKCKEAYDKNDTSIWPKDHGNYLQFAGMTVTYNPSLDMGKRIIDVKVGNEGLNEDKLYTAAMNVYVSTCYSYNDIVSKPEIGEFSACDEVLVKYFKQDADTILKDISKENLLLTDKTQPEEETTIPEETTKIPEESTVEETTKKEATTTKEITTKSEESTIEKVTTLEKETSSKNDTSSPQTSDNENNMYLIMLLLLGAAVIGFAGNKRIKNN